MPRFLILGCGFTGCRVARLLRARGFHVDCTNRSTFPVEAGDFEPLRKTITPETVVLDSIPSIRTEEGLWDATAAIVEALWPAPPARVVYLSTTGVYGAAHEVDEHTAPAPRSHRERLRVEAEKAVASGPWSSLILRPAAIYGPGRGMHSAMQAGTFRLAGGGSKCVSRIHVDDLAAHVEAALLSGVTGAYPVGDEHPCTSREAAQFCAQLLGIPLPSETPEDTLGDTRQADRRVDGSAIRRLLGVKLRYPGYREGFPACLDEEARARSTS
ncbi:MAG: NAD-dependent epimerase/dehydratase [Bryobacterales bacterium]|nr:NAD-dependent epimerase/dehydratase [Bryobacterales bacterium]